MELVENTLILATLAAVSLYFFFAHQQNKQRVDQVDADERIKRREHFAKAAEARVAMLRDDCVKTREIQSNLSSGGKEQIVTKYAPSASGTVAKAAVERQPIDEGSVKLTPEAMKSASKPVVYSLNRDGTTDNMATDVSRSAAAAAAAAANNVRENDSSKQSTALSMKSPIKSTKEETIKVFKPEKVGDQSTKIEEGAVDETNSLDSLHQTNETQQQLQDLKESKISHLPNTASTNEAQSPSAQPMTIHLLLTSSPTKPKITLQIPQSCTAFQLRQSACEASSVPMHALRIIYRGKVILSDDKSVEEYGLEDGTVLQLVGKPRVINTNIEFGALYTESGETEQPLLDSTSNTASTNEKQQPSSKQITIHLLLTSSPTKPKITLQISQSCTAFQLRQSASEASSVPMHALRIIYRGKIVPSDDRSVGEYQLEDGSVLHLVGKPIDTNNESGVLNTELGEISLQPIVNVNGQIDGDEFDELYASQSNGDDIDEQSNEHGSYDESLYDETGRPPIHEAAATGDMFELRHAAVHDLTSLYEQDVNGWTPIHEATRSGLANVIKFLVLEAERNGIPAVTVVNTVSNFGAGWSPLALAIQIHGEGHAVTVLLRQFGGDVVYPRR
jgi:hypothetical protein